MSLKSTQFRVIDLFCGCGGLSLGLHNAGYNIIAGFDNWKFAIDLYQKNFKHPSFLIDLGNLEGDFSIFKDFNPDIIVGGPPCQDFSSAGKRDETLGRGDLTLVFAEIIATIQPQFLIMENVPRFIKTQKYQQAKAILKSANYGLREIILDASLCGVPQIRKRFFWIGEFRGKDDQFKLNLKANLSPKPLTIRDYFNQIGKPLDIDHYYRHPRSYKRRGIFSIDQPSPTIRSVNRPIPKTYQPHPGDSALISPEIRPLTTLERSYIQTFPEDFIFTGTKTHLEQIIANAVPVKLAEYVGYCLTEYQEKLNC